MRRRGDRMEGQMNEEIRNEIREGFSQVLELMAGMNHRIGNLETHMSSMEDHMSSIETRMDSMETRMSSIETRMDSMETRMSSIETRMDSMETRMSSIETRMDSMETRMDSIENQLGEVSQRLGKVENDVRQIKITQETEILPRLNTIESCYTDTYKRYAKGADKIEQMEMDIGILKIAVLNGSRRKLRRKA